MLTIARNFWAFVQSEAIDVDHNHRVITITSRLIDHSSDWKILSLIMTHWWLINESLWAIVRLWQSKRCKTFSSKSILLRTSLVYRSRWSSLYPNLSFPFLNQRRCRIEDSYIDPAGILAIYWIVSRRDWTHIHREAVWQFQSTL